MSGVRDRRLMAGAAAIAVWLVAAAALVTFGGTAGAAGTAASVQYKPPPPPATILGGLTQPSELAADRKGNLWFVQGGAPAPTATLYVLFKGSSTPAAVYTTPGGDGVITPFIIDVALDAMDNPHFVQWTSAGSSVQSAVVRIDATTGTATTVATATGAVDNNFMLTSGSALFETELGADGTVYWTEQTVASSGDREARLYALAGATAPAVIAAFASPGFNHGIGNFTVAGDGTIYLQESSNMPGTNAGTIGIYRVAPADSPEPIRVFSQQVPGPRPIYVGLDGRGDLIVGERILNGFVRAGCADSTTFRLVRYDAAALAGPAPTGTVYSSATYPEFNFLFVGSSAYFRVSGDGDVLTGLYAGNPRCSDQTAPITVTHLRMIGVLGSDAGGTQHLLYDDAPTSPVVPGPYSFAFSGNDAYATSWRLGSLSRLDLNKNAKKPK